MHALPFGWATTTPLQQSVVFSNFDTPPNFSIHFSSVYTFGYGGEAIYKTKRKLLITWSKVDTIFTFVFQNLHNVLMQQ